MKFGVTLLPDPPASRFVELVALAERCGFEYAWTYDSHILWQDGYVFLALAIDGTSSIKLGHCVTNPGIREPTITASSYATMQDVSDGRMVMAIGRGDSSRRVVGLKPVSMDRFERSLAMIRDLMNGRPVHWNDQDLELAWAKDSAEIPMYVAGYGPRALGVAGRVGDGVVIQLADPEITAWVIDRATQAAVEAGRPLGSLAPMVCAPAVVSDDLAHWREEVRWFPAMVSNHVKDMIAKHGQDAGFPKALTDYAIKVRDYDYSEHSRVGAKHGKYISDEICDRFCILGDAEAHVKKIRDLEALGVTQVNLYVMTSRMAETIADYGKYVIPHFADA